MWYIRVVNERYFLLGDLHGTFRKVHRYLNVGVLDGSTIIQVGDFFGYPVPDDECDGVEQWKENLHSLNDKLVEHDCQLWAIRGNHEDPTFWNDPDKNREFQIEFSNITLIPDYESRILNDRRVLFVGGAISIDRHARTKDVSYWEDECVISPPDEIEPHDILIAHTCPSAFNIHVKDHSSSMIQWAHENDSQLQYDLELERDIVDRIVKRSDVKKIYHGHFHNSKRDEVGGVYCQCLNINELQELVLD